jgi:4-oxalocrotonate tautomerase
MDKSYSEIVQVLQDYFDGFYASDVAKLKGVFHPNCHLMSATAGPLADDDMDAVYARVAGREPPAAVDQKRRDRVLSIDRSGPEAALAKVEIAIGPRLYTDYLNLLRIDGRWWIVSKIYTYVPIEVEPAQPQAAE